MEQNTPLTPTSPADWQGVNVAGTDLALPSGNVARVRQISPQAFLASGMIPNPLMSIISKAISEQQGVNPKDLEKIASEPKLLVSALEMFDRVLAHVMIAPKVEMPPPCEQCGEYANSAQHENHRYVEGPRRNDVLYADVVQMDDKMFIFQWAMGGTRDLETFRAESEASLGGLSNGQDIQVPAV